MKKFLLLLVLVLVGVYGVGRIKLGEAGAMRFLAQMESLMTEGKGEEVCEMFHDDLEVEISDHSGDSVQETSGGKEEFCELTVTTAAGLNLVPHSSNVNFTEVESKQSLAASLDQRNQLPGEPQPQHPRRRRHDSNRERG